MTKDETAQATANNDTYMSLYEYLGKNYTELIKLLPTPTIELAPNAYQDDDLPF